MCPKPCMYCVLLELDTICCDKGMLRSTSARVLVSPSELLLLLLLLEDLDLTLVSALISSIDEDDEDDDCLDTCECL